MDRPEGISQKIWADAKLLAGQVMAGESFDTIEALDRVHSAVAVTLARALCKTREEALEEAAQLAEGRTPLWQEAEAIASAIRQHAQKGES